jgi:hypothetical protein
MSSLFPSVEGTIARCITVATKPRGGGKLDLTQPLPPARCGSIHIRRRTSPGRLPVNVAELAAAAQAASGGLKVSGL